MKTRIIEDIARACAELIAIGLAVAVLFVAGVVLFIAKNRP